MDILSNVSFCWLHWKYFWGPEPKRALKILSFDSFIRCIRPRGGVGEHIRTLKQKLGNLKGAKFVIKMINISIKIISDWFYSDSSESRSHTGNTRLRVKNNFSIFHSFLKSHFRSKIIRISWKFGKRCKMSQIIRIYKKKFRKFSPKQNVFFRFDG